MAAALDGTPYCNSKGILHRNRKNNVNIPKESQKTLRDYAILTKNENKGNILPDLKLYYEGAITKTV